MAVITTLTDLIADAATRTDRELDAALESGPCLDWARQQVRQLWPYIMRENRDHITKFSSTFTIPSGNTYVVTTAPLSLTDFLAPRGLDFDPVGDGSWRPLKPYNFQNRAFGNGDALSYRFYGTKLEIQPALLARTYPLRIVYLSMPDLADAAAPLDLPISGDAYVAEGIAAIIRNRFEEDPQPHELRQAIALDNVKRFLFSADQGPPPVIQEAGRDDVYPEEL